ncbi:uncharacterized protein [Euphorbia lathyris]|uniref:uncharacterized protein n=1 Tax=Euphorbia lathyris TaxID=212925 RepID=UPI0033130ECA
MLVLYVLFLSVGTIIFLRSFLKPRNHFYIMSTSEHSDMSYYPGPEDFEITSPEGSELSSSEGSEISSSNEESQVVKCSCGLMARLRVSRTRKNPYRLFYNCPRSYSSQCEFFLWADEPALSGDRHVDELNLIRNECTRLHRRTDEIEQRHNEDRSEWERERSELISEVMSMQNELMEIKQRIRIANESDLMPPVDKFLSAEDEEDDAIVIYTI